VTRVFNSWPGAPPLRTFQLSLSRVLVLVDSLSCSRVTLCAEYYIGLIMRVTSLPCAGCLVPTSLDAIQSRWAKLVLKLDNLVVRIVTERGSLVEELGNIQQHTLTRIGITSATQGLEQLGHHLAHLKQLCGRRDDARIARLPYLQVMEATIERTKLSLNMAHELRSLRAVPRAEFVTGPASTGA
jgi:hypothetical protein